MSNLMLIGERGQTLKVKQACGAASAAQTFGTGHNAQRPATSQGSKVAT
jgi:hypothetical protein